MNRRRWTGLAVFVFAIALVVAGASTCAFEHRPREGRTVDAFPATAGPTSPDQKTESPADAPGAAPHVNPGSVGRRFDPARDPYVATARILVLGPDGRPQRGAAISFPTPHAEPFLEMRDLPRHEVPGRIESDVDGPASFLRRTSDAEGRATVLVPARSSSIVRVAARGLVPRFVRLHGGDDVTVRLQTGRAIQVEVRDADGAPFEDARVAVVSHARTETVRGWSNRTAGNSLFPLPSNPVRTDASGHAHVAAVADGPNAVFAGGPEGELLAVATIHVPTAGPVRVRLPRPTTLTGVVRDEGGQVVAGLGLQLRTVSVLRPRPWDERISVVTDEQGHFRIRSWGALARRNGLRGIRANSSTWFVHTVEDSTRERDGYAFVPERDLEVVVARTTSLTGTVVPSAAAEAGSWVAVWGKPWVGSDVWAELARVRADADGRFTIEHLPARELVVFAGAPGWTRPGACTDSGPLPDDLLVAGSRDWSVDLTARDGGPIQIELVRVDGPRGPLRGSIRTRSDRPATGLYPAIRLRGEGHRMRYARSGADGTFFVLDASLGDVTDGYVTCPRGEHVERAEFTKVNGELRVIVPDAMVLRGRVVDSEGRPVEGAGLGLDELLGHAGSVPPRTDAAGRFSIEHWGDEEGSVTLHARHDELGYGTGAFDLASDEGEFVIELAPWPELNVRVVDARDRSPIPLADVGWESQAAIFTSIFGGMRSPDADFERKWRADEEGRLVVSRPPAMRWKLSAAAPGYVLGSRVVDLASDHSVELALQPRRMVEGRVLDADRRPISGAEVRVLSAQGLDLDTYAWGPEMRAVTDRTGAFRFDQVPETARAVEARRSWKDWRRDREPLHVLACIPLDPRQTHQRVELIEEGTELITGIAVDATGAPESGADVRIVPVDRPEAFVLLRTDSDGVFHVSGLRRVPYHVQISDGGVQAERVTITPSGDVGRVMLLPGLSLSGSVLAPEGAKRSKFHVRATRIADADDRPIQGGADVIQGAIADPDFEIEGLLPGRYRVEVFDYAARFSAPAEAISTSEARAGDRGLRLRVDGSEREGR